MKFLDTNVFLRYLVADDPSKAEASRALLQRVDGGDDEGFTSESVIGEVFYVLTRGRQAYRVDRVELAERMKPIVMAQGLSMPDKGLVLRALDVYAAYSFLDFEDALSVAHMESAAIEEIVSYDRAFDRVAEVSRVEP